MKLLITVVTHNRLEYTKRCLENLTATLAPYEGGDDPMEPADDYYVVVVDNASTDGTVEWLEGHEGSGLYDKLIKSRVNAYPGAACNRGWMQGLRLFPDATHLCRLDNDCVMHEGWWQHVRNCFQSFPGMGQFGLIEMSAATEFPFFERINDDTGVRINTGPTNIGGPNIILRELWDKGLRYNEEPWQHYGVPTPQEDVKLSLAVKEMGYFFGNTADQICTELSFGNTADYFEYYCRTFSQRGHGIPARTKDGEVIEIGSTSRDHI